MGCTGSEAVRQAGYKGQWAHTVAAKWAKRPQVRAAIEERAKQLAEDVGVRQHVVLRQLLAIATVDPRKLEDENGRAIPLHLLDAETAAAISSVDVENISINGETGTRYKYKFWDKVKANVQLGQFAGAFQPGTTHVNVDARSVTVHGADSDAVRRVDEFVRRIATQGGAAASGANGPVLPAPLRDGASGRGSPVDADPHPGSAGNP